MKPLNKDNFKKSVKIVVEFFLKYLTINKTIKLMSSLFINAGYLAKSS